FHRARTVVEVAKETETTTPKPKVVNKVERLSETEKLAQELAQKAPAPSPGAGGGERFANRPPRPGAEGGMENMKDRFANMSEEEKAQMRERMGGRRRGGGQNLSEEQRAQMQEQRRQMMEKMENMTEEEREEFRSQMRERMGGRRPGGGEGGRGRPGGRRPGGDGQGGGRRQEDDSGGGAPPPKGRACFVPETPVWVDGKLVQISKVTTDQTVGKQLCGLWSLEQVEEHEGTFECRDIELESGNSIGVVDAHCFMLDSGQWMAAQNLTSGLRLKTLTGTVVIKSVTKRAMPYTGKVYNLKVKSSDQYIAGKDMVVVRDY
ncbi:MAG: hypothetical protein GY774_39385, partial [Planctomycetes bacterium]|nr:hypothetical protein [Planctomycetota bacterium]